MTGKSVFSLPTAYTVLIVITALSAAATWFLPAGCYSTLTYDQEQQSFLMNSTEGERVLESTQHTLDDLHVRIPLEKFLNEQIQKPIAVPNTYTQIPASPQGIIHVIQAPIRGFYDASDVIVFVLVIGGFMGIFNRSGAFEAGFHLLAHRLRGRESWLIVTMLSLFALGGTTYGMAEETLVFYPILTPFFLSLGYDVLVPFAVIFIGASIGFMCSTINPFATIIASDAAGIDWMTGFSGRLVMWITCVSICVMYVLRYARGVKKDPAKSLAVNVKYALDSFKVSGKPVPQMDGKMKLLFSIFGLTFIVMIIGVCLLEWWFLEMTALFLVAGILIGILQGLDEKALTDTFIQGARELLGVSFIIGIARGVTIILNDGQVSDTILYYSSLYVQGMPSAFFIVAMMFILSLLSLLIPSSSGMAVLTMPIIAPLASMAGAPREEIVNAYLYGFGIMGFIAPTGLILPALAIVNLDYKTWIRFVWPLLVILTAVSMLFLMIGVLV